MEELDTDKDGQISYSEWVMATIDKEALLSRENLELAFKNFDKDNSGALSYEEIKEVLCFDSNVDEYQV